ncbi:lipase family protein [Algibacillus agarilyticus]|uniref:lipase family protein n=1 Tax=Algibacillus agarilyticus TaxID=2234133 RepID=UPI000DCFEBB2|nr:lipase family protein [Algibacillus agarilyticus]
MLNYAQFDITLNPSSEYDPQTALSLAVLCALAYTPKTEIIQTSHQWGFKDTQTVFVSKGNDVDTQSYVVANEDDIIIVFRGTSDATDWLTNIDAIREAGPLTNTKAHEGFQQAIYPAAIGLANAINKLRHNKQRIWITGHSLGGALCSLFAGMLIENNIPVHGCYTFASPRPANDEFAKQLNAAITGPHYRVANQNDLIPHSPPEPLFSHSGKPIILSCATDITEDAVKESWLEEQYKAIRAFAHQAEHLSELANFHTLTGGPQSYIPKLRQRARDKEAT